MKTYKGVRVGNTTDVTVDGKPLKKRFDLFYPGSYDFNWGSSENSSRLLALSILADYYEYDQKATLLYEAFMYYVISKLAGDEWTLEADDIQMRLEHIIKR